MKCLILAGGFGSRIQSIIGSKPKALLEYRGKPLISYLVENIPEKIDLYISTNKMFENDFNNWQKTISRPLQLLVEEAWSENQKMGALSAINFWVNEKGFKEDLLVIAADNYFEFDIGKFISSYDGRNTIVAVHETGDGEKARSFGVVKLEGRRIIEFTEKPAQPVSTMVATACYIFPPRSLSICRLYCQNGNRDLLGEFIAYLVRTDKVYGFPFLERWFDIGHEIEKAKKEGRPALKI
jgi:glucose-1-phosphate thymidylyltransferase